MRLALLGCFFLGACAGGASRPALVVENRISVVVLPSPVEMPFDPQDARLREATAQLEALAGHPVVYEFDVALLPDWRAGFQEMLIESIESTARDLDALRRRKPSAFSHGAPLLGRIALRYDARAAARTTWNFDADKKLLTLTGPAERWGIERGQIDAALQDEYVRWLDARFAAASAHDVPREQWPEYFAYWTDWSSGQARRARRAKQDASSPATPDPEVLLRVLDLSSAVGGSDPLLARELRKWLLHEAPEFASAYQGNAADRLAALQPSSAWRRAETAWVAWLNSVSSSLTDEEKLELSRAIFVKSRAPDGVYRTSPTAFPGFDRFGFGLAVADQWARAGHPRGGSLGEAQRELYGAIVCPHTVGRDGSKSFIARCDYAWYDSALDDPATMKRLADALLARKDADLVGTALTAISYAPRQDDKLSTLFALAHALDADSAVWSAAFRVIADERAQAGDADRWVDEAGRYWIAHPPRHGTLLYALVQLDRYENHDKVGWKRFAGKFGGPVDSGDFASFVDHGVRAMSLAYVLWPALSRGWSRAGVLVPRLDAYLADPGARLYDHGDPDGALRRIAERLCAEGGVGDMEQLRAFLVKRALSHPGEDYASIFVPGAECSKKAPPVQKAPPVLLFGNGQ